MDGRRPACSEVKDMLYIENQAGLSVCRSFVFHALCHIWIFFATIMAALSISKSLHLVFESAESQTINITMSHQQTVRHLFR